MARPSKYKQREITPRQKRFADEYLVDLNASQAVVRAGYDPKNAAHNSTRLLAVPAVREYIDAAMAARAERVQFTADDVLRELARLLKSNLKGAFGPDKKLLHPTEMPDEVAAAISSFDEEAMFEGAGGEKFQVGQIRKVKFHNKTTAIELAMRHLGMLKDKHEHELTGPGWGDLVAASMKPKAGAE